MFELNEDYAYINNNLYSPGKVAPELLDLATKPKLYSGESFRSTVGSSAICSFVLPYGTSLTWNDSPRHILSSPVGGGPGVLWLNMSGQSIKQPLAVIDMGGAPAAKIGDGRLAGLSSIVYDDGDDESGDDLCGTPAVIVCADECVCEEQQAWYTQGNPEDIESEQSLSERGPEFFRPF